ncbi:MAG TPA: MDR family MFS transporter [Ktedonobacterales bacterium]|nr:MDR family MFS transporter [Ktedonobacterales bacterium]
MAESVVVGKPAPEATEPVSLAESMSRARLVPIVIGLMLGMLLAALDQAVVGTAMPHVIADLGGTSQSISWVITAYLLASTVGVPIYGKLSDIYGRRIFFLAGMVIFLIGSALSGTSHDMTQLILYRGIQGLGAGALMPIAQAIIGDIFPPSERGKWQGLFMAVFGLATILGPLLGGFITDNWGWRWVFYVNMPVGVLAIITAGITMPNLVVRRQHTIDYLGSFALILWTVPLLLGLSFAGNQFDWASWQSFMLFGFAVVMLVAFFVIELRAAEPIINPALLKNSIFSVSVLTTFLLSAGMFGAITFLPYFVQLVLGQSATNSGIVLTPMMIGFMISSIIGGQILSRTGKYKILALLGFIVAAFGMFLLSRMSPSTTNGELVRNMLITGLGIGVMMSLFTIVVQNAFPFRMLGEVTATLSFFRSMGGTVGLAVLGTIMSTTFASNLQASIPAPLKPYIPVSKLTNLNSGFGGGTASLKKILAHFGPQQAQALMQQLEMAIRSSFSSAVTEVFLIGAVMMLLSFAVTLFLKEIPLRKSNTHRVAGGEAGGVATGQPGETEQPIAVDMAS